MAEANEAANQGGFGVAPLMILDSEKQRRAVAMELRFGKLADGVLAARGVVIDPIAEDGPRTRYAMPSIKPQRN